MKRLKEHTGFCYEEKLLNISSIPSPAHPVECSGVEASILLTGLWQTSGRQDVFIIYTTTGSQDFQKHRLLKSSSQKPPKVRNRCGLMSFSADGATKSR